MSKRCAMCEDVYPATQDYFYKERRPPYSFRPWCKSCTSEYEKRRLQRLREESQIARTIKLWEGQRIRVDKKSGVVLKVYEHFILVAFNKYRETFSKVDIRCGHVKIKEA